ncbi:MAG TPA: histidine kinase dimerization/phosphoacceptor domain -containing protein [Bryobacteraceae bacterium]|nr:histidine kinase dimerization/phosphoacceptor domain -containing protein [Bryobacteraceae bacterium]
MMVDDSAADRKLCRILLEEQHGAGLEFIEAPDAAHGLDLCRISSPDCVLLDYKLPDMTGLEFLSGLTRDASAGVPAFAVVMLTSVASEQVAVQAMKGGAQDYLVKDRMTAEGLSSAVKKATEKVGLIRTLKTERDRLAVSLAEKETLLKEVHHRVKNNLQVIASLLRLQADSIGDLRLMVALRESQNRVESMALIHEQLYETENLREVDLARHASLLASNLVHSYAVDEGRISWNVSIEPMPLAIDRAIPAGLILNELISNAFKHAFPGGRKGSLSIDVRRCGGRVVLQVRDDGVGMPEGADTARPKSLGLEIVAILTRQLKGTFEIERGRGALCRVTFPESYFQKSEAQP